MGLDMRIVEENSLRATEDGFVFGARLNWYRSLPLSSIEKLEVKLDGQPVDQEAIRVEINGHVDTLAELGDKFDEFWFVQDTAWVHVLEPGKVKPGEEHTVEVEIALRKPYMVIGPGKCLVLTSTYADTQVAAGGNR